MPGAGGMSSALQEIVGPAKEVPWPGSSQVEARCRSCCGGHPHAVGGGLGAGGLGLWQHL